MPKRKKKRRVTVPDVSYYEPEDVTPPDPAGMPSHLAGDFLIRQLGYRIHSRKHGKPAMWARDGSTYSAEEILRCYVSEEEIWEWNYARVVEKHLESHDDF